MCFDCSADIHTGQERKNVCLQQAGKDAEADFGAGGENAALPSTAGFGRVGVMPLDIRAYKVENEELVGQTVEQLFRKFPHAAVLKVVRGDEVIDASENPA